MSKQARKIRVKRRVRLENPDDLGRRNARVNRAMKIVGSAATRDEARKAIIRHDEYFFPSRQSPNKYSVNSKAQKRAVKKMADALRRLEAALKSSDLISALKTDFPMKGDEIERRYKQLETIAETKLAPGRLDLPARYAVQAAADFLSQHGVRLTVDREGKFCRLAEVFYRPGDAKLYHYCREYLRSGPVVIFSHS